MPEPSAPMEAAGGKRRGEEEALARPSDDNNSPNNNNNNNNDDLSKRARHHETSQLPTQEEQALASKLGFCFPSLLSLDYKPDFMSPVKLTCGLIMVPHGKTPANIGHLFQSHSDAAHSQLTAEGAASAERGAKDFAETYGQLLVAKPEDWVIYRSPLTRTAATAAPYMKVLRGLMAGISEPIVDPAVIEITQGSWDGLSVDSLAQAGRLLEAEVARQYRDGSFVAKAADGESKLEVVSRAAEWLRDLEARHGGGGKTTNVLVFGHGCFQNSVELLLRCYPRTTAGQLFDRNVSGSTLLRRGEAHVLAPVHGCD